ncbi:MULTISPECIES: hypothetical protein [Streptomyces]|uniref:hypothetical protein n=1 Tax=Streptomyces TaxID=1883 RepID=UPI0004CDDB9F|nr:MULTISPECIES: hypothetical protein [Streptomyces]KOT52706.1 hypothetical protein ADK43_30070 [Streptomyces rimosus subsp. rimosus]
MTPTTLLSYQILTRPDPLPTSTEKVPSTGTVHLIVFNPHDEAVDWSSLQITVPEGTGTQDLTSDAKAITPGIYADDQSRFQRGESTNVFRALPPDGKQTSQLVRGASLVLILDHIKVNEKPGLPLLGIVENAEGGTGKQPQKSRPTCAGVLKLAPEKIPPIPPPDIPRNFRAKYPLVDYQIDTNTNLPKAPLVLEWDGPSSKTYAIRIPGVSHDVPVRSGARQWSPSKTEEAYKPKRATTYTLIATEKGKEPSLLTTTIQVLRPTLDDGLYTPWLQRRPYEPYIAFAENEIQIAQYDAQAKLSLGTVKAHTVETGTVEAEKMVKTPKVDAGAGGSYLALTSGNAEIRKDGQTLGSLTAKQLTTDGINVHDIETDRVWARGGSMRVELTKDETTIKAGESGWVRLENNLSAQAVYGDYLVVGSGGAIKCTDKFVFLKKPQGDCIRIVSGGYDTC